MKDVPKQAFAAREAHEAWLELKKLVDEVAQNIHAGELESFSVAIKPEQDSSVRRTLQTVMNRLNSASFDALLSRAREKLEIAVSV